MSRLEQLYAKLTNYEDPDAAVAAIDELEAEAVPEWLPSLHEWLARPDDFFLRECVTPAVIKLEGAACLPRLLHALRLGTAEGHDNDTLVHYITELVEMHPGESRPVLQSLAASDDIEDREDAAWLLSYANAGSNAD